MKIVAIGYRLADLNSACFNTLSKYANNDSDVSLIIVSKKKNLKENNTRNYDLFQKNGISKIYVVDRFDFSKITQDNVNALRSIIEKIKPSLAIIPFNNTSNVSKKTLAESSLLACRGVESIFMYETNKNRNFVPTIYLVNEKTSKKKSFSADKKNTNKKLERKTISLQKSYAQLAGVTEPVEAFKSHRLISLNTKWF